MYAGIGGSMGAGRGVALAGADGLGSWAGIGWPTEGPRSRRIGGRGLSLVPPARHRVLNRRLARIGRALIRLLFRAARLRAQVVATRGCRQLRASSRFVDHK